MVTAHIFMHNEETVRTIIATNNAYAITLFYR